MAMKTSSPALRSGNTGATLALGIAGVLLLAGAVALAARVPALWPSTSGVRPESAAPTAVPFTPVGEPNLAVYEQNGSPVSGVEVTRRTRDHADLPGPATSFEALSPLFGFRESGPSSDQARPVRLQVPLTRPGLPGEPIDLFTWNGTEWRWVAGGTPNFDGSLVSARPSRLPANLAVGRALPGPGRITLRPGGTFAAGAARSGNADGLIAGADLFSAPGYFVGADGAIAGRPLAGPPSIRALPAVQNGVAGQFDGIQLSRILRSERQRAEHLAALEMLADRQGHAGLEIDYRDLEPERRRDFSSFLADLSERLHKRGKLLAVTFAWPTKENGEWQTGVHDWSATGELADLVRLPALPGPSEALVRGPELLTFATSQVDRRKIELALGLWGENLGPRGKREPNAREALDLAARVELVRRAGQPAALVAATLAPERGGTPLRWSSERKALTFGYQASDGSHAVWIENAHSLGYRLHLVRSFGLRGVVFTPSGEPALDAAITPLLEQFRSPGSVALVDPNDEDLKPTWLGPDGRILARGVTELKQEAGGHAPELVRLAVSDGVIAGVGRLAGAGTSRQ